MSKKGEYEVFLNIYKLALELSKSNKQVLNELSHYLVDNLISKICIFIAQENGLTYQTTSNRKKTKTFDFPILYNKILRSKFPNVPEYEDIKKLHDLRNMFQHGSESIIVGIRSEIASEYVRLTELILKEIGIVEDDKLIEPTNYLRNQYLKEESKAKDFEETLSDLDEEHIADKLGKLEKEFDNKILSQNVKSDLNMRFIAYPLSPIKELFSTKEISGLKDNLEKKASSGPPFEGFPTPFFNNLSPNREGFQYIAQTKLIGSIIIQREGLVLYDWRFGMRQDPEKETLPVHLMSVIVLGFLYFLSKFFNEVRYFDKIKIIINISNLPNWKYSREPKFMINRSKMSFQHSSFTPIECTITVKDLHSKDSKQILIQKIFDEILLGYRDIRGFSLREELKIYLEEN